VEIFPKIKEKYKERIQEMIFIQNPGDLVFVPGGWWHVVLNLDDTIAVTQNYCNSVNFESIWLRVRSERKKMAVKFLHQLKDSYPDLAKKALELNERDCFEMYNSLLSKKRKGKKESGEKSTKDLRSKNSSSSSFSSSSSSSDSD